MTEQPYRLVDANNWGWLFGGEGSYRTDPYDPDRQGLTFEQVVEQHGPIRPVEPITDEDQLLLTNVFLRIGRKSITTLAAALDQVFHELRESRGGINGSNDSFDYATRTLLAGQAGSWESAVLMEVVRFGNGLNLVRGGRSTGSIVQDAARRRAAGPSKRVDVDGRRELAAIIRHWVLAEDRYVEVAETLAAVVSRYADARSEALGAGYMADRIGGTHPWKQVADQWLMPGGLAQEDFSSCYRLLYSLGKYFNSDLI